MKTRSETVGRNRFSVLARLIPLALLLLSLPVARTAAAQGIITIFDTFQQPGDVYNHGAIAEVDNYLDEGDPFYLALAVPFTPGAGSNVNVTALTLAMHDYSGSGSDVIISLRQDNAGKPGTVIENYTATISTDGLYTFSSTLDPLLTGGTPYWVMAEGATNANGGWHAAYLGTSSAVSFDGANWINQGGAFALKIEGVVPEPPASILLGLGLLCFILFLRHKFKAGRI